ncbi:hypothetical protein EUAN_24320 [Andreesenia angusta]|uniref:Helix-turn-helix domain protein n=1 Tax=Andreesenia angusta TaxID=39480 RepID=A0A1S1V464_9FIRM|nr:helix-turn-helix domain-containing protein [Andreesenia angusta]OHW61215.1 hypothetical protein EUAN_24320 [Andreesenia angusta]
MKAQDINTLVSAQIAARYGLNVMERAVYEAIRKYKSNEEHTAYPSIGTIAGHIGCCRNTAKKYIKSLVNKGLIRLTERPIVLPDGKRWNDTHVYTFTVEKDGKASPKREIKTEVQTETPYQKALKEFQAAKNILQRSYPAEVCEKAFNIAVGNIRTGVKKCITTPLNYMKSMIDNRDEESQGESKNCEEQISSAEILLRDETERE